MQMNFRSAVFDLCKRISKSDKFIDIQNVIADMTFSTDKREARHGEMAYISRNQGIQFLGYLLTDDAVDDINSNGNFHVSHLDDTERATIEAVHASICFFITSCLDEITREFSGTDPLVNPYKEYKETRIRTGAVSLFSDDDIKDCVSAFRSGKIYRQIIDNDALKIFQGIGNDEIQMLAGTIDHEYRESIGTVPDDIKEFAMNLRTGHKLEMVEILSAYSVCCYALKASLMTAAQMIYEAMLGGDMVVMNNDNVINVSGPSSNAVYEKYTTLIQDVLLGIESGSIGSLALLTCDPSDNCHIKEYGVIVSLSVSLMSEFGQSSKVTIATVDNELNPIHNMTDVILESDIGV